MPTHPTVAIVAPASSAQQQRLDAGAAALEKRGWHVRFGAHAQGRHLPYFSADPADRLADLHAAFADRSIDAILCTRGGYGSNYLLAGIDLDLVRANPKPLLGYSDLTALQSWLLDQTGLVQFHAPMLAADFYLPDGVDEPSLSAVLSGRTHTYGAAEGLRWLRSSRSAIAAQHIAEDVAVEGVLHGGCLTLLAASLGTPFAPQLEGKLLFLEDVGTKPYQIDRMLRQLVLAGKLRGVTGIVFGEMQGCASPGAPTDLFEQAVLHALRDFPGPIATGLRSGHVSRANVTLPLGVRARLAGAGETPTLELLEPAAALRV
ncbi:LD-carboxypeptidase [Acidipila sp. EB88]|nr:LD-carboxypeptidase [Acidipila sp. EB88]